MKKKGKKELNLMSNDDFFMTLSSRCNYISVDEIKDFYYALVKLTTQELRHNGAIRYPDLGDFTIKYQKTKRFRNIQTGNIDTLPPLKTVRFSPDYKVARYFKEIS